MIISFRVMTKLSAIASVMTESDNNMPVLLCDKNIRTQLYHKRQQPQPQFCALIVTVLYANLQQLGNFHNYPWNSEWSPRLLQYKMTARSQYKHNRFTCNEPRNTLKFDKIFDTKLGPTIYAHQSAYFSIQQYCIIYLLHVFHVFTTVYLLHKRNWITCIFFL